MTLTASGPCRSELNGISVARENVFSRALFCSDQDCNQRGKEASEAAVPAHGLYVRGENPLAPRLDGVCQAVMRRPSASCPTREPRGW